MVETTNSVALRVAVVGVGWWGRRILRALEQSDAVRPTVLVESDLSRHESLRRAYRLPVEAELVAAVSRDDVDGVIVVTPHGQHERQVLCAAEAGKHVFCEKPLALSAAVARQMVQACAARDLTLGIGHERRFEPGVRELQRLVKDGELGSLLHIDGHWSHNTMARAAAPGWRQDARQSPCGSFTATGIHVTDILQTIGGRVAEVRGESGLRSADFPGEDTLDVALTFQSGLLGHLTNLATTPFYSRITVHGDRGWAELRDHAFGDSADPSDLTVRGLSLDCVRHTYRPRDVVLQNLLAWGAAAQGGAAYAFTNDQLVHNIEILEAIEQSAVSGEAVTIASANPI